MGSNVIFILQLCACTTENARKKEMGVHTFFGRCPHFQKHTHETLVGVDVHSFLGGVHSFFGKFSRIVCQILVGVDLKELSKRCPHFWGQMWTPFWGYVF